MDDIKAYFNIKIYQGKTIEDYYQYLEKDKSGRISWKNTALELFEELEYFLKVIIEKDNRIKKLELKMGCLESKNGK